MAVAIGCSLFDSAEPTTARKCCRLTPDDDVILFVNMRTLQTRGTPCVTVPVLSNTIHLILCAASSGSPPLIRTPFVAPTPVPTITAVGVARPRAQGQAMQRTVIAKRKACSNTSSCLFVPLCYSRRNEKKERNRKILKYLSLFSSHVNSPHGWGR